MITRANLSQLAAAMQGLPVYGCLPGSPADRAGVRYGDVLLSVDGQPTPSWDAYIAARKHSGASILLRLFREGRELEVEVPLDRDMHLDAEALAATLGMLAHTSPPPPPGKPD